MVCCAGHLCYLAAPRSSTSHAHAHIPRPPQAALLAGGRPAQRCVPWPVRAALQDPPLPGLSTRCSHWLTDASTRPPRPAEQQTKYAQYTSCNTPAHRTGELRRAQAERSMQCQWMRGYKDSCNAG